MANGNQSGFGTPGTQRTAQKNVQTGGVNPNMPVGQQLARQGASSYQRSLITGGASPGVNLAKTAYTAAPPPVANPSPLAGFPYKESLGLNASLGFSNEMAGTMPGYVPGGGDLESTYMPLSDDSGWGDLDEETQDAYLAKWGMTKPEAQKKALKEKTALGLTQGESGEPIEGEQDYFSPPSEGEAYAEYVRDDQPGIDPDTYAEMQQANVDDAEMMYQQGLQSLSRQYAMMGMTGSGAHMVANNALGKQIHAQLIQAQNVLAMENARIMEEDFAEKFDNAIRASETAMNNALKSGQIDTMEIQALAAEIGLINNELGQNVINFMEELGYSVTSAQASQFNHVVSTALSMGDSTAAAQWAAEQFGNILSGTEVDGWEPSAKYGDDSDAPFTDEGKQQALWNLYNSLQPNQIAKWSLEELQAYVKEHGELPSYKGLGGSEHYDVWNFIYDHPQLQAIFGTEGAADTYEAIIKAFGGDYDSGAHNWVD